MYHTSMRGGCSFQGGGGSFSRGQFSRGQFSSRGAGRSFPGGGGQISGSSFPGGGGGWVGQFS